MLGLFLFSVNLLPLQEIITDYGVSYELYADDNQLYIVFNCSEGNITNITLGSVISDTLHWFCVEYFRMLLKCVQLKSTFSDDSCDMFHIL